MNSKLYGNLIFELSKPGREGFSLPANEYGDYTVPEEMRRKDDAPLPECDEMTVVRHYTNHSGNNFGVNNGFYPLGSCTMKYNPVINEETANMAGFSDLHPLQPDCTSQGALAVYYHLQKSLAALTGLKEFTLNPFAGAHGELTGLMIIRSYHAERGDAKRTKVIRGSFYSGKGKYHLIPFNGIKGSFEQLKDELIFRDVVISFAAGDVKTDAFSIIDGKVHLGTIYLDNGQDILKVR